MSCANVFYVSNKFHARYRRVEYAMNAFGARVMHASVRHILTNEKDHHYFLNSADVCW